MTYLPCIYIAMPRLFPAIPSFPTFHFHGSRSEQPEQQSNSSLACIKSPQSLQNKEFTVMMTLMDSLETKVGWVKILHRCLFWDKNRN